VSLHPSLQPALPSTQPSLKDPTGYFVIGFMTILMFTDIIPTMILQLATMDIFSVNKGNFISFIYSSLSLSHFYP
jgi:hypothetical protein